MPSGGVPEVARENCANPRCAKFLGGYAGTSDAELSKRGDRCIRSVGWFLKKLGTSSRVNKTSLIYVSLSMNFTGLL